MKEKALEERFHEELSKALETARRQYGVNQKRLLEQVEKQGGLSAAKAVIGKGRPSEGYYALEQKGALPLSLEALAAKGEYAPLFTDEEANHCMELLCEAGYYHF